MIDVDVSGEPAPETEWFFEGKKLENSEMVKTAHSAHHTKLMLIPAKRILRGKYTIRAKNSSGEDEASVVINIRGKPTAPRDLKISDVTKNKVKTVERKCASPRCELNYYENPVSLSPNPNEGGYEFIIVNSKCLCS